MEDRLIPLTSLQVQRTDSLVQRTESQSHGFLWEQEILQRVYGATPEELRTIGYTHPVDLPANLNRLNGCDVSIKTTCHFNTVCMADVLRVYDESCQKMPIHLTVLYYRQHEDKKHLIRVTEVDLTQSQSILFGRLDRKDLESLVHLVKQVPPRRKPTAEEHQAMYTLRNQLQERSGMIHLDIKCNSTQSRVQCSFRKFRSFVQQYPERVIADTEGHFFQGGTLTATIESKRRIFHKRTVTPRCVHG